MREAAAGDGLGQGDGARRQMGDLPARRGPAAITDGGFVGHGNSDQGAPATAVPTVTGAQGMNVLDLFCGASGGWSLGLHRAGFTV